MGDNGADQGVAGVGMILAGYVDEGGADAALEELKQAQDDGEFAYDDAAVVRRDSSGEISSKETGDMSTGKGAGIGALIGGVVGLLGGPGAVALGAGAGAAIGALASHKDAGFDNETIEKIGGALPNGTSALAVTTSKDFIEAVREASTEEDTASRAQEIADTISGHLNAGQDVLMAMVLTEEGVAASKVVSSPDELSVFGIAASDEGVVAGGAVATPDGVAAGRAVATDAGAAAEGVVAVPADDSSDDDSSDDDS